MAEAEISKDSLLGEVKDTVIEGIRSRLTDPIVGTFFISFVIASWDIWFLAFAGDRSAAERISDIWAALRLVDYPKPFSWSALWNGVHLGLTFHRIVVPGAVTIAYLFFWPKLMRRPLERIEKERVARKNIELRAQVERFDIKDMIHGLQREVLAAKADKDNTLKEVGAQQLRISQLEGERDKLKQEVDGLKAPKKSISRAQELIALTESMDQTRFAEFGVTIAQYAKEKNISKDAALHVYEKTFANMLDDLQSRFPESNSLKAAAQYSTGALKSESAAAQLFLVKLGSFKSSPSIDDVASKEIDIIIHIYKQIVAFRT